HTLGHAIENMLALPHGHAISVGMVYAAHFSGELTGFRRTNELISLLEQFELPTHAAFDHKKAVANLAMDKKRTRDQIHFVLLEKIGKAVVKPIAVDAIAEMLTGSN
ncbi:MAG TPA: hypothetical protein VK907_01285, partial [Phnomibacter sp.]|nr:hypothetical protein [Phnomibacter sp.]